ncbi:uncharacterized protein LOC114866014 [Betta splendens]|uniref:Uncharacterized protein LOC114866014 n=1 Tax=Betta splendens TaxID=158456 RepID=A0A8M1HK98_BETSP|nr:uncharacterized protein LOC114866014 [Betta splendens]
MSGEEVLYSDVTFTRTKENERETSTSGYDTTYSEISILKSQPAAKPSDTGIQQEASNKGSKVTPARASLLLLCGLLAAAVIGLSFDNFQTKKNLQTMEREIKALKRNLTVEPCPKDWDQHGGSCYYFSSNKLTWNQSRSDCKSRGADLVQINSEEKQWFLEYRIRGKMNSYNDWFWIGLTDSKEEDRWLWVDDSPLNTSLSFWHGTGPDNWTGEDPAGEDCAIMGMKTGAYKLKCWFDITCNGAARSVCEKPAESGQRWSLDTWLWSVREGRGGEHDYGECGEGVEPKCCNCGGKYSVAFRGCEVLKKEVRVQQVRKKKSMTSVEAVKEVERSEMRSTGGEGLQDEERKQQEEKRERDKKKKWGTFIAGVINATSDIKSRRKRIQVIGGCVSLEPSFMSSCPLSSMCPTGERAESNTGSKVRSERVALLLLSALLAAAAVVIYRLSSDHCRTKEILQLLKAEPCPTCEPGWDQHEGSCYYFSSYKLTWDQSRSVCKGQGADLVQVDSEEEQRFLENRVRGKMNDAQDKFWIGLTDSEEEGRWLWVDDSPLNTSCSFWSSKQPDNYAGTHAEGEDCVRMGLKGGAKDLRCWFDRVCSDPQKHICEKAAAPGRRPNAHH